MFIDKINFFHMSKQVMAIILVIVLVAGGVGLYLSNQSSNAAESAEETAADKAVESVLAPVSLPEIDIKSNPVEEKVPETNPVQRANPFNDVYKNPFK